MTKLRVAALAGVAVLVAGCSSPAQSGPAPTPFPETPSSSAAAPDGSFSVVATGDVLIHPALTEQAEADGGGKIDYRPLLAGIKPLISGADLGICHLETPLAPEGGPYSGYPSFSAPPEIADALKDTGYDTCSTSSNHTIDQGADGVEADPGQARRGRHQAHRFGAVGRGSGETAGPRRPRREGRAGVVRVRVQRHQGPGGQAVAGQPDRRRRRPGGGSQRARGGRAGRDREPALGRRVPARPDGRAAVAGQEDSWRRTTST